MKRLRHVLFLVFALVVVAGCARRPAEVLDDREMERILLDIHRSEGLLDVLHDQYATPEEQRDVMAAVLVRNGVTRQQYDTSLVWYSRHLNRFIRIYLHVHDSLSAEQQRWRDIVEAANIFPPSEAGDTVDVWPWQPYVVMGKDPSTAVWRWTIPADSNYVAGDSLVWTLRLRQVPRRHFVIASLGVALDDDGALGTSTALPSDTIVTLSVAADTTQRYVRTHLSLSLVADSAGAVATPAFVDSISVVRIHRR